MSPILVRPVREQLEHDRVIRLLQGKWRKKYEAVANPGDERNAFVKVKGGTYFPDLILSVSEGGKKSQAVVEVETSESLNHLEAMAQWTHFSKAKAFFYLYVPAAGVDVARRLAEHHAVRVSEMWSYYQIGDQVRFLQVSKEKGTPELSMEDEEEEIPAAPVIPPAEVAVVAPKGGKAVKAAAKPAPVAPAKATRPTPTTKASTAKSAAVKVAKATKPAAKASLSKAKLAKPAAKPAPAKSAAKLRPAVSGKAKKTAPKAAVKKASRPPAARSAKVAKASKPSGSKRAAKKPPTKAKSSRSRR